ncbi:hypothetical protein M407DRAFT_244323 [Tulasnella calospora MUT 4182]|uniref:Uncharacterized protein n=1 Tax=Tulasnella calospora MUT 4182 TaxID=1051891 RepID=A0A0C3Q697_9AGAM|nr:hypothetical protein M407DRAFT_244323 [Tulasnella calospora MUT 4182]
MAQRALEAFIHGLGFVGGLCCPQGLNLFQIPNWPSGWWGPYIFVISLTLTLDMLTPKFML